MPPLPSTPDDLHSSIARRLDDIETYQIPRLAKCTGPIGLQRELADETKGDLEQVRRNIELCKELGEGLKLKQRQENATVCQAFQERYKSVHGEYRRAVLSSKSNLASSSRHLLFRQDVQQQDSEVEAGPSRSPRLAGSNMADDALQTRTNDVTDALRRTTQTMQAELERSVLSVQMLEDSTRTLRSTANLYDTYTALLETSGNLIKQLEKADWWDRLVIFAAFFFFLLCVGWIIKRRVLDRVVGGVGWWVGGSFKLIGMGMGIGGGGKVKGEVGQVGAGKVGRTPDGMGRVGLAGGREKPKLQDKQHESIADAVVPPDSRDSADSAVRSGGRDEL